MLPDTQLLTETLIVTEKHSIPPPQTSKTSTCGALFIEYTIIINNYN